MGAVALALQEYFHSQCILILLGFINSTDKLENIFLPLRKSLWGCSLVLWKHFEERAGIKVSRKTARPLAEFSEPMCTCAMLPGLPQLHICSCFGPVFISRHLLLGLCIHECLCWLNTWEVVTHLHLSSLAWASFPLSHLPHLSLPATDFRLPPRVAIPNLF